MDIDLCRNKIAAKVLFFLQICKFLRKILLISAKKCLFHGHLAVFAVKMEFQHLSCFEAQITRFLIFRIRIGLPAMPQFEQEAVAASHQMIVFRLHSFKMLMGIK